MTQAALKHEPFTVVCDTTDRDAWLAQRKTGIGASEIAVILGLSPFKSELELYAIKVGAVEPDDLSDSEPVLWGNLLEPVIREQFAKQTGRDVARCDQMLRSTEHPWATATPDGWIDEGGERWPLEIKTTSAFRAEDWANGPPDHYMAQVQHQMLVTDTHRATIACLLGGQRLVWCDVDRDEQWTRKIVFHGQRFWRRVQEQDPPTPDGSESSSRVLNKLFPEDDGSMVELPVQVLDVVEQWQGLKGQARALDVEIRKLENTIKATLGDHQRGVFHGGGAVSWATTHRKEHTVKASTYRRLLWHPPKD